MGRWITKNGVHVWLEDENEQIISIADALSLHYQKEKLPTVYLPIDEYAHVISEINTWYNKTSMKKGVICKAIGNNIYTFENKGYNKYRFIDVVNIEDILDLWEVAMHVK